MTMQNRRRSPPRASGARSRARPNPLKRHRALPALSGLGVLGAIGGTAWAGYRSVTTSSRFAIAEITVHGNRHVTTDQVRAVLPIAIGDNVFATDLDTVVRELRSNPWIASA